MSINDKKLEPQHYAKALTKLTFFFVTLSDAFFEATGKPLSAQFMRADLLNAEERGTMLHIGVIKYAMGDVTGAKIAWENSNKLTPNPWALRNLSMIYKNELGDINNARKYILDAFNLKRDCLAICKEVAAQLTSDGNDSLWIDIFDTLDNNKKNAGRILLYCAVAYIHLEKFDEASQILNEDFVMNDVKEGELSVSYYWFELYRRIYAKENGVEYDPNDSELIKNADEKYPLPKSLDFRMHG